MRSSSGAPKQSVSCVVFERRGCTAGSFATALNTCTLLQPSSCCFLTCALSLILGCHSGAAVAQVHRQELAGAPTALSLHRREPCRALASCASGPPQLAELRAGGRLRALPALLPGKPQLELLFSVFRGDPDKQPPKTPFPVVLRSARRSWPRLHADSRFWSLPVLLPGALPALRPASSACCIPWEPDDIKHAASKYLNLQHQLKSHEPKCLAADAQTASAMKQRVCW